MIFRLSIHADRAITLGRRLVEATRRAASGKSVSVSKGSRLSQWQHDRLVDLAVDRDAGLLTISRNFGDDDDEFGRHVRRLLLRRNPKSILLADASEADSSGQSSSDDESSSDRKVAEPQVELASRE